MSEDSKNEQQIMVPLDDLDKVDGIGAVRATAIKQALKRMQEQFIFDNLIL